VFTTNRYAVFGTILIVVDLLGNGVKVNVLTVTLTVPTRSKWGLLDTYVSTEVIDLDAN